VQRSFSTPIKINQGVEIIAQKKSEERGAENGKEGRGY
jgi:hypothetical protein